MIKNSKQNWTVGQKVKVGFMSLVVRAAIATPGDGLPDSYLLTNADGTRIYRFVPHNGIESISPAEAQALLASVRVVADRIATNAIARARQVSAVSAVFA